jgi:hypothetical protein
VAFCILLSGVSEGCKVINQQGWVYSVCAMSDVSEGTIGCVLNKKIDSYFVCFFTERGKSFQIVKKEWIKHFPIEQELQDIQFLIDYALKIRDYDWVKQLNQELSILNFVLEGQSIFMKIG